ncbi:MAG TPA: adenylate/guanylate cyclase domain-containing protein [Solirubrobacterales bacterium]|nr:adenylate/guanylate cyclase domain-containing protein [Solirubrobacterales bacterium]
MVRRPPPSLLAALAVALLVAGSVLGARALGLLESMELAMYDGFMRLRPPGPSRDPRVVVVTVSERDIQTYGWPLADGILARAIEAIARHDPRAIGLDIYRDVPVPPGSEALDALLARDARVIAVTKFAEGGSTGVQPPRVLKGTERVGFNDILVDSGGVVRRALLFLDDGTTALHAFALRLALLFLQSRDVVPQADPSDPGLLRLGRVTIRPLESNDGGYVRADARGYQFLLDFKGAREAFASVDLGSLLTAGVDPAVFRDRIVLIGVTAESIKDEFFTPFSRGLQAGQFFAGVTIHAHIASQLLRMALDGEPPMAVWPEWPEWVWIALWCLAGAVVGLAARSPWRFPLATAGGLAALAAVDFVLFLRGWWLPLVPPALGWLAAAGGVTAYMSYHEGVQRAVLMQLFSRHVSREVAETIWKQREQFAHGGRPRSERMEVTALFTDLTGYTTVSERHSPDALLEWLNEYMAAMAREVSKHGGVIRQYAGDSVVAVFGIPVPRRTDAEIAQDARNAVECALAMEASLRELNRRWKAEGRQTTGMRVGILTGPVVAGTLGSAERSEYVVVGDTMNTASRLESFDKAVLAPDVDSRPCRILIGEPTLERLGGLFETEYVGEVSLKGKEHRVSVHRVIGRRQEVALASAQVYEPPRVGLHEVGE